MTSSRRTAAALLTLLAAAVVDAADLRFAHGLYRDKRYQLAADEYKSFLTANPSDAKADEAKYFLAESFVQLKRLQEAASAYESVSSADAAYFKPALFRAGTIRKRSGDVAKAQKSLEKFVLQFPDDADSPGAWLMLAECRLATKKLDAALDAASRARLNIEKESRWWGRLQLVESDILRSAGKTTEAIDVLTALASSRDPLASEASLRLGTALFAGRKFAEAAAYFDKTAAATNDSTIARQANYNAGLCYIELKSWSDADRRLSPIFEAEIPEEPDAARLFAQAGQALVQVRLGSSDRAGARSVVEDAIRRFGNNESSLEFKRLAAEIDLADGKSTAAAAGLKALLRDAPADADRSALIAAALRAAAATADAEWAILLLQGFNSNDDGTARRRAEQSLSEADWKDASAMERLLTKLKDGHAKARMNYRLAAGELERSQPSKAVARLQKVRRTRDLPADLKANTDFVLGGALVQLEKWSEAFEPLEAYLQSALEKPNTAEDPSLTTAARWWARCLTWLSDVDAQKRIEPILRFDRRPVFESVASSIAGERRSGLALWLLGKLPPPESRAAAVVAARCLVEMKKPDDALAKLVSPSAPEELYLAGVASLMLDDPSQKNKGCDFLKQVADADPPTNWSLDAALRLSRYATTPDEAGESERRLSRLAAAARGPDQRRLRLELAFLAAQSGKTLQAIADLKAFIEQEKSAPEAVEAALKLAELHESRGESANAEAALAAAEKLDRVQAAPGPLLFRRASLAYRAKNWSRAETLLSDYLAKYAEEDSNGAASLMLGEVALERQRADDAVQRFTALKTSSDPAVRATATLRLAQAFVLAKKFDDAERTAVEFLNLARQPEGRKAEAHYVQGRSLMNRAKFADARAAFEKAAVDESSDLAAKARFMVGETYFHQKKFDLAMKEYLRLAVLGHDDQWRSAALLQVGKCHENLGDSNAAAEDYRRLVDQFPTAPASKQAKERLQQLQIGARNSARNPVKE